MLCDSKKVTTEPTSAKLQQISEANAFTVVAVETTTVMDKLQFF